MGSTQDADKSRLAYDRTPVSDRIAFHETELRMCSEEKSRDSDPDYAEQQVLCFFSSSGIASAANFPQLEIC
jgi:hypothetical protein